MAFPLLSVLSIAGALAPEVIALVEKAFPPKSGPTKQAAAAQILTTLAGALQTPPPAPDPYLAGAIDQVVQQVKPGQTATPNPINQVGTYTILKVSQ